MTLRHRFIQFGFIAVIAVGIVGNSIGEPTEKTYARATFAGGCFWCMQPPFARLDGVIATAAGYTGGHTNNPTYEKVSRGNTGHTESVQIVYDPRKVSYEKLLDIFWHNIDPTTIDRQFCDAGSEYRTAIFFHDAEQEHLAKTSKQAIEATKTFPEPIVTEITPASTFYPAEEHHQDYSDKNPVRYQVYRYMCKRDARLAELWGSDAPPAH
ncbi:MAG: peptide-methionine (S)-S-oxide reductase [Nitrospiraceae bacterium]|nr:peptide-methionine (S)-S-oxide reductase [Nitrospiraceae bacterium]|tara:strand:+ start:2521 stop:3153 length:633 start_codon:yes stop_codon:yes gene_type:complete